MPQQNSKSLDGAPVAQNIDSFVVRQPWPLIGLIGQLVARDMISRRSAQAIGAAAESMFASFLGGAAPTYVVKAGDLYDFFYVNDYPVWMCNTARGWSGYRAVQEWIMRLHTGESLLNATSEWDPAPRRRLGQKYLEEIAEDLLIYYGNGNATVRLMAGQKVAELERSLNLDGYVFTDGQLNRPETDVLNVEEERSVLEQLYLELGLGRQDVAFHHLTLSEEHFREGRWDDTISNARKFFECVLTEIALSHSRGGGHEPPDGSRPAAVRDYLRKHGLLEKREWEAMSSLYGLLSETGAHPYMAADDQARLLRQLSLTLSQFAMLRLRRALGGA